MAMAETMLTLRRSSSVSSMYPNTKKTSSTELCNFSEAVGNMCKTEARRSAIFSYTLVKTLKNQNSNNKQIMQL